MAFRASNLKSVSPLGEGGIWMYKTEDTSYSSYFPADNFNLGDRIYVTVVTNQGKTSEAYASGSTLIVTAVSDTYATVA
jgi:hypothetical protein